MARHQFERAFRTIPAAKKLVLRSYCTCGGFSVSKVVGIIEGKPVTFGEAEDYIDRKEDAHGRNAKWKG